MTRSQIIAADIAAPLTWNLSDRIQWRSENGDHKAGIIIRIYKHQLRVACGGNIYNVPKDKVLDHEKFLT